MDINVVIENIVELLTNSVNMTSKYYDIFFNPTPMDVTLEQYNDNNELVEVTIPNRAKDLKDIKTGTGSPEGVVSAPVGTLYIDSSAPRLYIKADGDNENGWSVIPDQEQLDELINEYLQEVEVVTMDDVGDGIVTFTQGGVTKGSITMNQKGNAIIAFEAGGGGGGGVDVDQTYNPNSTNPQSGVAVAEAIGSMSSSNVISALGYTPYSSTNPAGYISTIPTATSTSLGAVKFDNTSVVLNSNSQLRADGVVEQRASNVTKFWVGTESQYNSISSKNSSTVYIITDTSS